ncbi:MAG: DUF349 domain-containing protein, partial [Cytophagaceae bacterium]
MANQEQEINQQPEIQNLATDSLAVNTPEDNSTPVSEPTTPEPAVEDSETTMSDPVDTAANAQPESVDVVNATETTNQTPVDESTPEVSSVTVPPVLEDEVSASAEPIASENTDQPAAEPTSETSEPVAETTPDVTPSVAEADVVEEMTAQYAEVHEPEEETLAPSTADYSQFSKQDFVNLLETQVAAISLASVTPGDFKKADQALKDVKPLFDQMKRAEREAASQAYIAGTGSEEGFE